MGVLFAKLDDIDRMAYLCVGCAGASVLFLLILFVVLIAWIIRRDFPESRDDP